ncbi:MAG: hypothetical protein Q8R26_01860 [bacterium]|nr:hypothetical protein [bacterium]
MDSAQSSFELFQEYTALRQAQCKHFGKLSASTSASSVQALRQAQCKHFGKLSASTSASSVQAEYE